MCVRNTISLRETAGIPKRANLPAWVANHSRVGFGSANRDSHVMKRVIIQGGNNMQYGFGPNCTRAIHVQLHYKGRQEGL